MPKKKQPSPSGVTAPRKPVEPAGEGALMTTRIDPPHQVAGAEPAVPQAPAVIAAETPPVASPAPKGVLQAAVSQAVPVGPPLAQTFEQMESQAAQLGALLSKQQATLDRREAEVNARAAAVESQVRAARLWLVEKLDELAERKAELSAASDDASQSPSEDVPPSAERYGRTAPTALAHDNARQGDSFEGQAGTLRFWKQLHWHEEFERWRSAREALPEGATVGHRGAEESSFRGAAASESTERQRATEQQLAARATALEVRRRELAAERETLDAEREAFIAERQADLHRLADQRRMMVEKLARQRARLRRRRDAFDAREMAMHHMRAELLRTQQQALEMRLGAEEMWARLHAKAPAANGRREGAA